MAQRLGHQITRLASHQPRQFHGGQPPGQHRVRVVVIRQGEHIGIAAQRGGRHSQYMPGGQRGLAGLPAPVLNAVQRLPEGLHQVGFVQHDEGIVAHQARMHRSRPAAGAVGPAQQARAHLVQRGADQGQPAGVQHPRIFSRPHAAAQAHHAHGQQRALGHQRLGVVGHGIHQQAAVYHVIQAARRARHPHRVRPQPHIDHRRFARCRGQIQSRGPLPGSRPLGQPHLPRKWRVAMHGLIKRTETGLTHF